MLQRYSTKQKSPSVKSKQRMTGRLQAVRDIEKQKFI